MTDEYSYAIHDAQTGTLLDLVEPSGGDWIHGSVEEKTFTFNLRGDGRTRAQRRDLFRTWERAIVVRWNDIPVYAGLICGRPYRPASGVLVVKHIDARSLLARRMLFGIGSYASDGVFDFRGYTTRGVVRQLLYYGLLYPYSAAWPIHAEVGGAETGSSPWAQFYHYDFQNVESILSTAETQVDGPDVDLAVEYRTGNVLWWVARIGTPFLSGTGFETRLQGNSILSNVDVDDSGLRQATGIFTTGRGFEQDMRVGQAALPVSSGVSRDYVVPFKDVDDVSRLNSLASGQLSSVSSPRVEWKFNGRTSDFSPSEVQVGSIIRVFSEDDEWVDDGWSSHRVLTFAGSVGSETLTFEVEDA